MTLASMWTAAQDEGLRRRVEACAQREARDNPALADTNFGRNLVQGYGNFMSLYWAVAVHTEAAYYSALQNGRGAPGHDTDIITDADILAGVQSGWPPDNTVTP